MRLLEGLIELLYPTRCAGCDLPGILVCDSCRARLPTIDPAGACPRCGAPFGWLVCTECWDRDLAFDAAVCAGSLEHPLSRLVTIYKDGGERRLAVSLAELIARSVEPWAAWVDAVAYIPATLAARRRRGFDHARDIAVGVARLLGVPVVDVLERGEVRDQRALNRDERFENARGTFRVTGPVASSRVLLIDDVLTTGATLDAAAAALKSVGVAEVRIATVARAW